VWGEGWTHKCHGCADEAQFSAAFWRTAVVELWSAGVPPASRPTAGGDHEPVGDGRCRRQDRRTVTLLCFSGSSGTTYAAYTQRRNEGLAQPGRRHLRPQA